MKLDTAILPILLLVILVLGCGRLTSLRDQGGNANTSPSPTNADNSNIANTEPDVTTLSGTPLYNVKTYEDKGSELGNIKATSKEDPSRTLAGKIAVVSKKYDFSEDYDLELFSSAYPDHINTHDIEGYGISKEQIAKTIEELDTLVRLTCKTKTLGTYTLPSGKHLPAKGLDCTVEMIDYKSKIIFAKKTFKHGKLKDFVDVSPTDDEVMNYDGLHDAEKYIKSFPR
ncbi:MAG: hypothetical protein KF685_07800 [Acidobacteria bacterium]|nr:hypothetical protein [Acidobacteriota bacterium]